MPVAQPLHLLRQPPQQPRPLSDVSGNKGLGLGFGFGQYYRSAVSCYFTFNRDFNSISFFKDDLLLSWCDFMLLYFQPRLKFCFVSFFKRRLPWQQQDTRHEIRCCSSSCTCPSYTHTGNIRRRGLRKKRKTRWRQIKNTRKSVRSLQMQRNKKNTSIQQ